jgi:hypothetical protein
MIMKKLDLDMNALEVESFETSRLGSWEGTVHGQADVTAGGDTKCGGIQTCGEGCGGGGGGITAGGATKCGGIQTCGDGCGGGVTAGGATKCGGVQTCGDGCNA